MASHPAKPEDVTPEAEKEYVVLPPSYSRVHGRTRGTRGHSASKRVRKHRSTRRRPFRKASPVQQQPAPEPTPVEKPKKQRKARAPRKQGRKMTREQFVDSVVIYEATGNRPVTWAAEDDFKRYIETQAAITPEEMAEARKRCGL